MEMKTVRLLLIALAVPHSVVVATLLLPALPLPLVLVLERWVLSTFSFSSVLALVLWRIAYVGLVLFAAWTTFTLAIILWN